MAWWGLALAAWGNPFAAGVKPAAQIERGLGRRPERPRHRPPYTPRVPATSTPRPCFTSTPTPWTASRLLAYRDAMAALAAREPGDTEAAIFHALAQAIAADPADKSYTSSSPPVRPGAALRGLPGPSRPRPLHHPHLRRAAAGRAGPHRRAPLLPHRADDSHALHMPSHTYTRVGDWRQSDRRQRPPRSRPARGKARRRAAARRSTTVYAYLQLGQDQAARAILTQPPRDRRPTDPNRGRRRCAPRGRLLCDRRHSRAICPGAWRMGRGRPPRAQAQPGALCRCRHLVRPRAWVRRAPETLSWPVRRWPSSSAG